MSHGRKRARRPRARAFQPTLEGQRLEQRLALSHMTAAAYNQYLLTHPAAGNAAKIGQPKMLSGVIARTNGIGYGPIYTKMGTVATMTAHGGQSVIIAEPDGSRFRVSLQLADNQYGTGLSAQTGGAGTNVVPSAAVQPQGTVRAYAMPGGQVGLIVDGTTQLMALVIDPLPFAQRKGFAKSFAYGETGRSHMLQIGSLQITSGYISQILGYHDANLNGPLTIGGTGTVDRIALNNLSPGAAIGVNGTVNTLDIAQNVNLTSGPGITIGRDLNLLNIGQNLTLTNGASLRVGRFLGLVPQPPKGSASGSNILSINQSQIGTGTAVSIPSVSAYVLGNITIGPGSVIAAANGVANSSVVAGTSTTSVAATTPTVFLTNGVFTIPSATAIQVPGFTLGTTFFQPPINNVISLFQPPANNMVARAGIIDNGQHLEFLGTYTFASGATMFLGIDTSGNPVVPPP